MNNNNSDFPNSFIELKSVTWNKDSHGLFDYENKHLQVFRNEINGPCEIYRNKQEITIKDSSKESLDSKNIENEGENFNKLSKIITENNNGKVSYFLESTSQSIQDYLSSKNEETFLVIRSLKNSEGITKVIKCLTLKGYPIVPGDIIKLGRVEYAIIECRTYGLETFSFPMNFFCSEEQYIYDSTLTNNSTESKICRICLEEAVPNNLTNDINNLLIKPCKCKGKHLHYLNQKGSCEYVHISCLHSWLTSKHIKKTIGNATYYYYKRLECEVCKECLPKSIIYNGNRIELIKIDKPLRPYLILESIVREKNTSRGIFLIEILPGEQIKIGRGHHCDLRISDISVSRLHAIIKYENNQFRIYDNSSKFGTLLLLNKPFEITNEKMAVQIGRTVISLVCKSQLSKEKLKNDIKEIKNENNCEENSNKNL